MTSIPIPDSPASKRLIAKQATRVAAQKGAQQIVKEGAKQLTREGSKQLVKHGSTQLVKQGAKAASGQAVKVLAGGAANPLFIVADVVDEGVSRLTDSRTAGGASSLAIYVGTGAAMGGPVGAGVAAGLWSIGKAVEALLD